MQAIAGQINRTGLESLHANKNPKHAKVQNRTCCGHGESSSWEGYCRSGVPFGSVFFLKFSSLARCVVGEKGACVYGLISVAQWTLLLRHYFLLSPTSPSPGIAATCRVLSKRTQVTICPGRREVGGFLQTSLTVSLKLDPK